MTIIDTPEGINAWRVLSAVSLLSLELSTGQNYYGKTSVYKGIRLHLVDGLPPRATVANKCLALVTILAALDEHTLAGPVATRAQRVVDEVMAREGLVIEREIVMVTTDERG